jgi:hypothetical protein
MTRAFHLAGLPSLDDQADVEGVIRRQTRRLREVVAGLDELESTISRLEKSLAQDAEPRSVETPIARLAKTKAPAARKSPRKAAAAKAKKRSARKVEPVPVKPQPLGAARKAAPPTSAKSLLDLQFKKRK